MMPAWVQKEHGVANLKGPERRILIEQTLARTGSVAATMRETGYSYPHVRAVLRAMTADTATDDADDIDPVAVERFAEGRPPNCYTQAEKIEAIRVLASRGLSDHEISRRMGIGARNIWRARKLRGIPSGVQTSGAA